MNDQAGVDRTQEFMRGIIEAARLADTLAPSDDDIDHYLRAAARDSSIAPILVGPAAMRGLDRMEAICELARRLRQLRVAFNKARATFERDGGNQGLDRAAADLLRETYEEMGGR
jgi:hypothetical protein